MANIRIPASGTISISRGTGKKITLTTKDMYVPEDIDVHVKPQSGSFANSASTGVSYTEETQGNTVIASNDGYLYLNAGWFDNTKISLGHLIPDIATGDATSNEMRSGYKAYNEDGELITGVMPDQNPQFDGGELTITPAVNSLTVPTVSVTISGKFAPEMNGSDVLVSGGLGQNYGVTTNAINGTEGADFLSIDAGRSVTNGSVKAKVTYSRAAVLYNGAVNGYVNKADNTVALSAINATSSTSAESTIEPAGSDGFPTLYIPIVRSIAGAGGDVTKKTSGTNTAAEITTTGVTSKTNFTYPTGGSASTYGIVTLDGSNTAPTDSVKFNSSAGGSVSASGTATIAFTRAVVELDGDAKGAINMGSGASLLPEGSGTLSNTITGSGNVNKTGTEYYIPIVNETITGGALTVTASGSATQPNFVYAISSIKSGTSNATLNNYGIAATTVVNGANGYLTFVSGGDYSTRGSYTPVANANTTAVHESHAAGLVVAHNRDIVEAHSGEHSTTINLNPASSRDSNAGAYRMPIVTVAGTGGGVQKTDSSAELTTTVTGVSLSHTGKFTDTGTNGVGASYGVHSGAPSTGTDGTNYLKITTSGSGGAATTSGIVTISYSRAAVTTNADYKGAVSMSSGDSLLVAGTGSLGADVTSTGSATISGGATYYIDIVSPQGAGGGVSKSSSSGAITGTNPTVTLTTNGTLGGKTAYGVTTTAPTGTDGTNFFSFQATGSSDSKDFTGTATINYSRAAVTAADTYKGAVSMTTSTQLLGSTTGNFSHTMTKATVTASVTNGTKYYVPIVTVSGTLTPSAQLSKPKYSSSVSAAYHTNSGTSVAGFLSNAPSSGEYITITPATTYTNGSLTSTTSSVTIGAGITAGGTLAGDSVTTAITGTNSGATAKYIAVYGGSYSLVDL